MTCSERQSSRYLHIIVEYRAAVRACASDCVCPFVEEGTFSSHLYSCVSGASDTRHTETGDGDKGREDGKRRLKGESIN